MDITTDTEPDGPLELSFTYAFSPSTILNYEATNTAPVGTFQPYCQTRTRGVMMKRPVACFFFSAFLFALVCSGWKTSSFDNVIHRCDIG